MECIACIRTIGIIAVEHTGPPMKHWFSWKEPVTLCSTETDREYTYFPVLTWPGTWLRQGPLKMLPCGGLLVVSGVQAHLHICPKGTHLGHIMAPRALPSSCRIVQQRKARLLSAAQLVFVNKVFHPDM